MIRVSGNIGLKMSDSDFSIRYIYSIVTLFFIGVVAFIGFVAEDNFAVLGMTVIFVISGLLVTLLVSSYENLKNSIYLFLLFFLVYLSYSFGVHYILDGVYNVHHLKPDEVAFLDFSNDVANRIRDGHGYSRIAGIQEYVDMPGTAYYNGWIATLSNIFGENTVLTQKIATLASAALSPMVMYGISRLYLSEYRSMHVALIFGFLSFTLFLSSIILRDIHIALMFIIAIYIILQKISILNMFTLVIVSVISYTFREQTGIFMIGLTAIYFFSFINIHVKNKFFIFFIYTILVLGIVGVIFNSGLMDMFHQITNSSAERSASAVSSGSLGAKIAKLPFGLNLVALLGFSQLQPFPPSWIFSEGHKGFLELSYLVSGMAWFLGWGFLLYGIFKKDIFTNIDIKMKLMFFSAILFLVLVAFIDFNPRRQMPVYPILYMIMVLSYLKMTISERTKVWVTMGSIYVTLVLVFNYLKL
jgi:hypothetical protein